MANDDSPRPKYLSFMLFCFLDALIDSSKKKETRIKKEIVEVFQQASYRRNRLGC